MSQHVAQERHLSPPFVLIEGVLNCHALPLPRTASSKDPLPASTPFVLRAGDVSRITPCGITQLQAYGIRTIFDLRTPSDIAKFKSPIPVIEGVDIIQLPLVLDQAASQDDKAVENGSPSLGWYKDENIRDVYQEFLEDELGSFMRLYTRSLDLGSQVIAQVLRCLIKQEGADGVMFHCNGGKDRTGVLAAITLSLAGVGDDIIIEDYALTSAGMEPFADGLLKRFENDVSFQENREGAMNLFSSRPQTMRAFLELIREKYGGAKGYVRNVAGLNKEEIAAYKEKFLSK